MSSNKSPQISIAVENLSKTYGKEKVVKNISFCVKKNEIFGLLGPNGAGKTTTLEMIEALRPIDSGKVHLEGYDVKKQPLIIKRLIGVQPQETGFFEYLNLCELLDMFAGLYNAKINAQQILDEVQLTDKAKAWVKHLSGGQRQRFSVALALVNQPKVLFLDEPTTGLDPQARRNMWHLIEQIRQKGITIVFTTHYMEEAEHLCDRLAIMDNGRIIALDKPQALIQKLLKTGFKKKSQVQAADLEDVFISLTGRGLRE